MKNRKQETGTGAVHSRTGTSAQLQGSAQRSDRRCPTRQEGSLLPGQALIGADPHQGSQRAWECRMRARSSSSEAGAQRRWKLMKRTTSPLASRNAIQ